MKIPSLLCCIPNKEMSSTSVSPAVLTSAPIKATVTPGNCQFGEDFVKVPLLEKTFISETAYVARFGLPDTTKALGLSTCACILAGAEIDGEMTVRPYTPISTNADLGTFDLLIRKYPEGKMSSFISELEPSPEAIVAFKHIKFNIKVQYPFNSPKNIVMLAGGTGITPMIQALHAILGDEANIIEKTHLIYGSRAKDDILGKEMLDKWSATHADKLSITHVLSHEEGDVEGDFRKGFISKEMIEELVPPPSLGSDVLIFVCGPPVMYDIFCGPRGEEEITGILGELGYGKDQVVKF
jgi:cytochrome-b5 reductase